MGTNTSTVETSTVSSYIPENTSENEKFLCVYESVDFDRLMFILAFGTPCAMTGILCNMILSFTFFHSHHIRTCNLYFAILAALDTVFCILYIFLMTIDAVCLHYGYTRLYAFYISYSFPLFAVARIIQLASVYMMVAATVERWFVVRNWSDAWSSSESNQKSPLLTPRMRLIVVLAIFGGSVCLRAPLFWEYSIEERESCNDPFGAYQFVPRLAADESYQIFNFYIMNLVQVLSPFLLLTMLNVSIIRTLRRRLSLAKKFLFPIKYVSDISFERGISREKLKSGTYTLVAVGTVFLVSSLFNTFITVIEYVAGSSLLDEDGRSAKWYTLSSDISSVLVVLNSVLRLPLYCLCSRALRREMRDYFLCHNGQKTNKDIDANVPLKSNGVGEVQSV